MNKMANILVVDDEPEILILLKKVLEKDGHVVTCVSDGIKIASEQLGWYDLILLDVMMPGEDGFSLCGKIRDLVDCPILFLTAKTMEEDVNTGFSIGADDYIKKPFSIVELRARVNAHLRREKRGKYQSMQVSEVRFFLTKQEAYYNETRILFTKSEYEISEFLAKNHDRVFSKEQIYEQVFGYEGESDVTAITEHVKNIRKKLQAFGLNPIETVWGVGYKWKEKE